MAVKMSPKQNPHILYMDELDAIEDDEVFANFGQESILHPEPKPRTSGFSSKEEFKHWIAFHRMYGQKIKEPQCYLPWACVVTPMFGIVGFASLVCLLSSLPPDVSSVSVTFFLSLVGFLMAVAFAAITFYRKFGLCCFNDEIKVSRVYNAHHPDEYIDIDY